MFILASRLIEQFPHRELWTLSCLLPCNPDSFLFYFRRIDCQKQQPSSYAGIAAAASSLPIERSSRPGLEPQAAARSPLSPLSRCTIASCTSPSKCALSTGRSWACRGLHGFSGSSGWWSATTESGQDARVHVDCILDYFTTVISD